MSIDYEEIKFELLDEFELQINKLFKLYKNNKISSELFISKSHVLKDKWKNIRMDLKNVGNKSNSLDLIEYNKNFIVSFPEWFKNNEGEGCILSCEDNDMNLIISCVNDGELTIKIRGPHLNNIDNQTEKVYLNLLEVKVNDEVTSDKETLIWHNDSYTYTRKCSDSEIIKLDVKVMKIFDYFPQLEAFFDNLISDENLIETNYIYLSNYLKRERVFNFSIN